MRKLYGVLLLMLFAVSSVWPQEHPTPPDQKKGFFAWVQKKYLHTSSTIKRQYQDKHKRRVWLSSGAACLISFLSWKLGAFQRIWKRKKPSPTKTDPKRGGIKKHQGKPLPVNVRKKLREQPEADQAARRALVKRRRESNPSAGAIKQDPEAIVAAMEATKRLGDPKEEGAPNKVRFDTPQPTPSAVHRNHKDGTTRVKTDAEIAQAQRASKDTKKRNPSKKKKLNNGGGRYQVPAEKWETKHQSKSGGLRTQLARLVARFREGLMAEYAVRQGDTSTVNLSDTCVIYPGTNATDGAGNKCHSGIGMGADWLQQEFRGKSIGGRSDLAGDIDGPSICEADAKLLIEADAIPLIRKARAQGLSLEAAAETAKNKLRKEYKNQLTEDIFQGLVKGALKKIERQEAASEKFEDEFKKGNLVGVVDALLDGARHTENQCHEYSDICLMKLLIEESLSKENIWNISIIFWHLLNQIETRRYRRISYQDKITIRKRMPLYEERVRILKGFGLPI